MIPIEKMICGGQSGGDLTGAKYAKKYDITLDINVCKDFKPIGRTAIPKDLKIHSDYHVVTQKTGIPGLKERTEFNVTHSDITVILLDTALASTRGSQLTADLCNKYKKPWFELYIKGQEGRVYGYAPGGGRGPYMGPEGCKAPCVMHNEWYLIGRLQVFFDCVKSGLYNGFIINIAGTRKLDEQLGIEALELLLEKR